MLVALYKVQEASHSTFSFLPLCASCVDSLSDGTVVEYLASVGKFVECALCFTSDGFDRFHFDTSPRIACCSDCGVWMGRAVIECVQLNRLVGCASVLVPCPVCSRMYDVDLEWTMSIKNFFLSEVPNDR